MATERTKGFAALAITVACWVASSELMQWLQEGESYNHPVTITMSCALSFLLYGIPAAASHGSNGLAHFTALFHRLGLVAGTFTLLWITANLAFTAALDRTSSASAVTISSTSAAFALGCSVAAGVERFSWRKLAAVVTTCIGTALTCVADSGDASHGRQLVGDGLAFGSAAMYALYLVLFQKDVGDSVPTEDFLFVVGVWALALVPLTTVFEPLVWPDATSAGALLVNAVVGTAISERAWLYGAARCGPTTATMALALTIPFTATVDMARGRLDGLGNDAAATWACGLALICGGFVLASTDSTTPVDRPGSTHPRS